MEFVDDEVFGGGGSGEIADESSAEEAARAVLASVERAFATSSIRGKLDAVRLLPADLRLLGAAPSLTRSFWCCTFLGRVAADQQQGSVDVGGATVSVTVAGRAKLAALTAFWRPVQREILARRIAPLTNDAVLAYRYGRPVSRTTEKFVAPYYLPSGESVDLVPASDYSLWVEAVPPRAVGGSGYVDLTTSSGLFLSATWPARPEADAADGGGGATCVRVTAVDSLSGARAACDGLVDARGS
jgi:hypothetical protein